MKSGRENSRSGTSLTGGPAGDWWSRLEGVGSRLSPGSVAFLEEGSLVRTVATVLEGLALH